MASCLISDAPYAAWLSDVLATLEEHKVTKIAVAAPLPGGEVFTGYFAMGTMDKALMATNIQADATMDAICANGPLIQQAWEDAEENEDDPRKRCDTNGEHHLGHHRRGGDPDRRADR